MTEPNDLSDLSLDEAERLSADMPDEEVEPGEPTDDQGDEDDDEEEES